MVLSTSPAPAAAQQVVAPPVPVPTGPIPLLRQEVRRPPLTGPTPIVTPHVARRHSRRRLLRRTWAKVVVIAAATGLVGTAGLPAYAYSADSPSASLASGAAQTLKVGNAVQSSTPQDDFSIQDDPATLDSTEQSTVSGSAQYLAKVLMAAVVQGRLVGNTPNHLFEIRYLAEGKAVMGCGVDYRVLQAIEFALQHFQTVGVSDINRRCTGQIEGAGTESAHYEDGGGHAVDFFMLDGQGLDGGNAMSLKLIELMDPIVPPGSDVGQSECRAAIPLVNFDPFPDTCDHVHMDFIKARGTTLTM